MVGAVSEVAFAFQICENCCLEGVVVVEVVVAVAVFETLLLEVLEGEVVLPF